MKISTILRRQIITEKSSQNATGSRFVFQVARKATKGQIKVAIEATYPVTVTGVRTLTMPDKTKRTGKMKSHSSTKIGFKKAIIQLKSGDKIDLFDTKD